MPLTPSIIKQVHALTDMDNMPKGLKIQNCTGVTLFNSSWTAGVDFNEEQFNNGDYSMSSDESEEGE
eukprot:8658488-Ditylum_brightwellii.AAC.1